MLRSSLVLLAVLSAVSAQQCVNVYNQCGGTNYKGVTNCCSGNTCKFQSQWYSQCVPGSVQSPSPSPSPVRTSPSPIPTSPVPSNRSPGCGKNPTLRSGNSQINSGGTNRLYNLNIPSNYNSNTAYRLVFGLHWLSGSYNDVSRDYYGLLPLSQGSTIFVAPDGIDKGWANTGDRDIRLMDDLLKLIQNDLCIDTSKIFATGFSYGGGMSYSLACSRPNVFRAVGVLSGAQLSGCNGGTTPVAYFASHGISDSVLNISMGRQIRDTFVKANKCSASSPPEPSRGSGTQICTSYTGCASGYPVRWCAFDGDHQGTPTNGRGENWVPGELWNFFKQF